MRILRGDEVERAIAMPAAIDAMRAAFAQLARGVAVMPGRVAVGVEDHGGTTLVMPAYLPDGASLGLKVVSVFPGNAARRLPVVPAAVLLLDPATGLPLALLDGTYLTALRTGAASGLAADLLARPEARVATLFGAGGQAPYQLEAVCRVRRIKRAWLVNRTAERAERLRERVLAWPEAWRPGAVRVAQSADEARQAVEETDIILTATSASEPLFAGEWVRPGTHVGAVGAYTPEMREVDAALVGRARVVVDQRAAALAEAGDLLQAMREGAFRFADAAELGEIVMGSQPGRTSLDEITFFKSVGVAAQDMAVAAAAYQEAVRLGLGTEVELAGAG